MKKEAMFYSPINKDSVNCFLCNHRCKILQDKFGICGVRKNINGKLFSLVYGEVIASNIDPIEKKPLYHFLPGTKSFSIATIGCNFKCDFCQNWQISQISKKDNSFGVENISPEKIVEQAKKSKSGSISYTYTEPTIFFEYAYDIARLAKKENIHNVFVTNGYMTKEAIETISPYLDAANIDLKSFNDNFYKKHCNARLQPVLDSIKLMFKLGIHIEITTLVIPGLNDSREEFENITKFIAELSKDIPWHISRFHSDYKLNEYRSTPIQTLETALEIGENNGIRYAYMGNVNGGTDTYCYYCNSLLIKRKYYDITENNIKDGKCAICQTEIKGKWD